MDKEFKWLIVGGIIFVIVLFFLIGPATCSRHISSWKANSYGSDWLVIQYAQDGSIINNWELKGKSIGNEHGSDGIFFTDNFGNVVHLSGHYLYIQVTDFDSVKEKYSCK